MGRVGGLGTCEALAESLHIVDIASYPGTVDFVVPNLVKFYSQRIRSVVSLGPKIVSESDSSRIVTSYCCRLQISSRLERRSRVSFPRLY